jgi:hypothetical protein
MPSSWQEGTLNRISENVVVREPRYGQSTTKHTTQY